MNFIPFLFVAFLTALSALVGLGWLLGLTVGLGITIAGTIYFSMN